MAQNGINATYVFLFPRREAADRYAAYLQLWREAGHPRKPRIGVLDDSGTGSDETDERAIATARPQVVEAAGASSMPNSFDGPVRRTSIVSSRPKISPAIAPARATANVPVPGRYTR